MLEMRTHPRTFRSAFFEPIALTQEELDARSDCHGGPTPPREHCRPLPRRRGLPLREGGPDLGPGEPLQHLSPARASKVPLRFLQKGPTSWDGSQVPLALRDLPRHRVGLSLTTSRQPPARLQESFSGMRVVSFLPPSSPFFLS